MNNYYENSIITTVKTLHVDVSENLFNAICDSDLSTYCENGSYVSVGFEDLENEIFDVKEPNLREFLEIGIRIAQCNNCNEITFELKTGMR